MESLVLLKLFTYDDKPARTKDVTDICHIVSVYFDLHDEIYEKYMDFWNYMILPLPNIFP